MSFVEFYVIKDAFYTDKNEEATMFYDIIEDCNIIFICFFSFSRVNSYPVEYAYNELNWENNLFYYLNLT